MTGLGHFALFFRSVCLVDPVVGMEKNARGWIFGQGPAQASEPKRHQTWRVIEGSAGRPIFAPSPSPL